jgi:hypothetical protein
LEVPATLPGDSGAACVRTTVEQNSWAEIPNATTAEDVSDVDPLSDVMKSISGASNEILFRWLRSGQVRVDLS